MRHLSDHDTHIHVFIRTWYCVKLNTQTNFQKIHPSSYWKCRSALLHSLGQHTVQSLLCPLLCLPALSKARAAALKDANFLPLNAVNANMLTFMHSRKTVEQKSSWAFYCTVKQRAQVSQEWQKKILSSAENPTEASKFNRKFQSWLS